MRISDWSSDVCSSDLHKSSKCELPFSFSISDETVLPSGHIKNVRHSFNLWTAKALRTAHRPSAGDFYERASAYQKEIAQKDDLYFLSYDGGWFENDPSISKPYWFLDVLQLYKFRREPDQDFIKTNEHSEGSALKT